MAIDIRASVTCSLGHPILSGSISDDYLQGSGLIKTRGSLELSALITPAVGTAVTFSYVKNGVTRTIPRKLRVLSSFADPFRRTTKVELGCKLTYLSDLKDPIDWSAFSDPENAGYTADDAAIVTLPIHASSVMNKCLAQLGILASSNPLTNRFSIPEFDFSPGYVQVLSDLLVSESYFGYLDTNEVLQVRSLNADGGTGPVFTSADIVDLGPIGVGQLPGEAVTVSYSSLVLKAPTEDEPGIEAPITDEEVEEQERLNWESTETVGSPQTYIVTYKLNNDLGELRTATYTGTSSSVTRTTYETLKIKKTDIAESEGIDTQLTVIGLIESLSEEEQEEFETNPTGVLEANWPDAEPYEYVGSGSDKWIYTGSGWEKQVLFPSEQDLYIQKDVVKRRTTDELGPLVSVAASVAKDYLTYTGSFSNPTIGLSRTVETFTYDKAGNQTGATSIKYEPSVAVASSISVSWADSTGSIPYDTDLIITQITETSNDIFDDYTQEATSTSIKQAFTQSGQQAIAKAVEEADSLADMSNIISHVLSSGLVVNNSTVTTSRRGVTMAQERPPAAARTNRKYTENSPAADPSNGFRTESSSGLVLAVGSAAAQRRIELSMPYAPDDTFTGVSGGPYYSIPSDAKIKAMTFGRIQNRLLLGNRNGMNLQLSPERLPSAPFDPLYVQANGLTGLYRANGTSWAFDSNGIVASIDALFWGAVGGTGIFWFPVAPGITTLPTTPAIVNGEMNATTVVLPYNETAIYDSRVRLLTSVTKFDYSLELLTVVPASVIRTQTTATRILKVEVPTAAVSVAAYPPLASISAAVAVPAGALTVAAYPPSLPIFIPVPSATIQIAGLPLQSVGLTSTSIFVPSGAITVAANLPSVSTGASVTVPATDVVVASFAPVVSITTAPQFETLLYTGTGSSLAVTGAGFEPGFVLTKRRLSLTQNQTLYDYARGATKYWTPSGGAAEVTDAQSLTSFDADGFTLGTSTVSNTSYSYVAWCIRKGAASTSNTDGTITTSVYANADIGMNIFTYTGTGANATVGHGLGSSPELVIFKNLSTSVNTAVGGSFLSSNQYLILSTNAARATGTTTIQSVSSTTVSIGSSTAVNENTKSIVGYAFKSVAGVSDVGTYTGTGASDQTISVGFEPRFLLIKAYSTTGNWMIFDSARGVTKQLLTTNAVETTVDKVAFNATDFTVKANQDTNTSAVDYVYLAFA